jgi:hypothetical protein
MRVLIRKYGIQFILENILYAMLHWATPGGGGKASKFLKKKEKKKIKL